MGFVEILAWLGIPSAITGVIVWLFKRRMDKREAAREAQEQKREQMDLLILQGVQANAALAKATAEAVQRIPEAHCNGNMTRALEYAQEIKNKQKDFLNELGIHALHDD